MRSPKYNVCLSFLLVLCLLFGGLRPSLALAQETTEESPPSQGLRPDAPSYGVRGSYSVGTREMVIEDGSEPLHITVWYPALNTENVVEETVYTINDEHPLFPGLPISGRAIEDAKPVTEDGPYPLVVFSPGLGGWSQANSFLSEHLASHGFVVIAWDPRGESLLGEYWAGAAARPLDTQRIIDFASDLTDGEEELSGLMDSEQVGLVGHSSGGWTALIGGGGQYDFGWCEENPDKVAEHDLSNCHQFPSHQAEIAEMLGLESVPDGMWPAFYDSRIKAIVPLAPDGDIWGADFEGLIGVKVPTLLMAGSRDLLVIGSPEADPPPETHAFPMYQQIGSAQKILVGYDDADHMIFFNQCRDTLWMLPDFFWACSDPIWDMDRAHDLINHFTTTFLLAELTDDKEAAAALASDQVSFPGIEYRSQGYDAPTAVGGWKDTVFIQGVPYHNANGIEFGPDNLLYIPSVVGREIVVMDPDTGEILDRFGPEAGMEGPDDLAFDAEGNVYWTGILTGEVGKHSPDGEKTTVAMLPPGPNPITFSDDGRLFVALCFLGDALYELDPAGVKEPRLIYENQGDGCGLNGMDIGPDGYLYGPRWFQNKVVRIDVETGEATTIADGFGTPAALNFDSQGRMVVLDTLTGEVVQVDIDTGEKTVIAALSPGMDNLAFDSQDRLFISSFTESSIVEVMADGTVRTVSEGGLTAPGGIAILGDSLFVAEVLALKEFDLATGEQLRVEHTASGFTPLAAPFSVSAFGENLLSTSWFGNVVQLWNPATGETLHDYTDIAVPIDAVGFQGDVIVTELGTGSVVRFAADDPTQKSTVVEGLTVAAGLAATEADLWVSDWATGDVLQIVADGEVLAEPIAVATGLANPEGIAIDADGSLLVVETGNGQLTAIEMETGETSVLATGLALGLSGPDGYPPTYVFSGVAVGADGAIYVAGDVENVIYRVAPVAQTAEAEAKTSDESKTADGILAFSTFGNGPERVIAIHNFWDNQKQYEPLQPYLDPQAYTYAFADLRGYGASKDIPGEYTAEEAALDVIALADHLGWDRFHLVGHSMSGMIVQRVAVEAAERVKSIVALTPVPASGTQLDEDTVGFFASVVADRQSTYDYFRMAIPMFSESYAAFRADRSWESAAPEVKHGYLRMWNNTDFSEDTLGLETPILVVLGEYDEGFNQLVMPFWSDWYPNSEIVTGANATHHITEDTPVFVASAIENFLALHR